MTSLEYALGAAIIVLFIGLLFSAHRWRECLKWVPDRDSKGRFKK